MLEADTTLESLMDTSVIETVLEDAGLPRVTRGADGYITSGGYEVVAHDDGTLTATWWPGPIGLDALADARTDEPAAAEWTPAAQAVEIMAAAVEGLLVVHGYTVRRTTDADGPLHWEGARVITGRR